jgi:hypothetical protein
VTSCRPFFPSPPHRPDPRVVNPVKVPTISTLPPIPAYLPTTRPPQQPALSNNPPSPTTRPLQQPALSNNPPCSDNPPRLFRAIRVFRGPPTRAPSSLASLRLCVFASLRETPARHPQPIPLRALGELRGAPVALARTEYRSAEYKYEYEFANRKNGREMRKAMGRNFPLISWAAGPAASAVIMVR